MFWRAANVLATFFGLFIPSLLAVAGSYWLYQRRQRNKARSLRTALKGELSQMAQLGLLPLEWEKPVEEPIPESEIPPPELVSTTVFEASASQLGLLDDTEVVKLVEFYSSVVYIRSLIDRIRRSEDTNIDRHQELYSLLTEYEEIRRDLLAMLSNDLPPSDVKQGLGRSEKQFQTFIDQKVASEEERQEFIADRLD